jgi:hypothetical protein
MPDPIRSVRLSDAAWSALERIAAARGILYGGTPSRGAALVWLIERELRRLDRAERAKPPAS